MAKNNAINLDITTGGGYTYTFPSADSTLATLALSETLTNKDLSSGTNTFPTLNQNTTGSAATLTTTRTIWGQNFNGSANVTGDITLSTANITMTGSLAATGARVTKGWFTDIESTNMYTVGGTSLSSTFAPIASPTFTGTVTLPTGLTGIAKLASGVVSAVTAPSGAIVGTSDTQTLTNKRVTPRILSAASYTTDTGTSINGDTLDMFIVTAQTGALKFNNPSGTPTDGQKLIISVASSTTSARALTWDTAYGATTVALPTTTAATTATLTIGLIWSASKSLWQCVAVA